MTLAITLKVNDGVVIASDSATTMSFRREGNVYNHADKIFNLHKGIPIAAVGFGLGNIGPASLATLMKDLRARLSDKPHPGHLDTKTYTVEAVANAVKDFLFDEHYKPHCESIAGLGKSEWPYLRMMISGYSASESRPEVWRVTLDADTAKVTPDSKRDAQTEFTWGGDASALHRLLLGFDRRLPAGLAKELSLKRETAIDAVKKVAAEIARWQEAFETSNEDREVVMQRLRKLNAKRSELAATLGKIVPLRQPPSHLYAAETIARFQESLCGLLLSADSTLAKSYLRFLVEQITVRGNQIDNSRAN